MENNIRPKGLQPPLYPQDTLAGTHYENEPYDEPMPFNLFDKEFELDDSDERPFFDETLLHSGDFGRTLRVRTVRYPDMDALGVHPNIVKVFVIYSDGYIMHGEESLYDAAALKQLFGIGSGERYLESINKSKEKEQEQHAESV
jgi:hypothetical protein